MLPSDYKIHRRDILAVAAGGAALLTASAGATAQPAPPANPIDVTLQFFAFCISDTPEGEEFRSLLRLNTIDPSFESTFQTTFETAMQIAGIWGMVPDAQLQFIRCEVSAMLHEGSSLTGWEQCSRLWRALRGEDPNGTFLT